MKIICINMVFVHYNNKSCTYSYKVFWGIRKKNNEYHYSVVFFKGLLKKKIAESCMKAITDMLSYDVRIVSQRGVLSEVDLVEQSQYVIPTMIRIYCQWPPNYAIHILH